MRKNLITARADWPLDLQEAVRKTQLTIGDATQIVGGPLGSPGKMPCATFGQDAFVCQRGSELAQVEGSVCHECYARTNFYRYWRPAIQNRQNHQANIYHDRWVDAMVVLVLHACRETPYFRWFDSGDLDSVEQLRRIVEVCERTPRVKHWLATREITYVKAYLSWSVPEPWNKRAEEAWPSNLVIRISADMIGEKAPDGPWWKSTVHWDVGQPVEGFECEAYSRDMKCGPCRACWSPNAENISYPEHS